MSAADIVELERLATDLAELAPEDPAATPLDREFHFRIIRAGKDPMIEAILETIHRRGADYHVHAAGKLQHFKEASDRSHLRIVAAIRARDAEGARSLIITHIRDTFDTLSMLKPRPELTGD